MIKDRCFEDIHAQNSIGNLSYIFMDHILQPKSRFIGGILPLRLEDWHFAYAINYVILREPGEIYESVQKICQKIIPPKLVKFLS